MRTIIAGSRNGINQAAVDWASENCGWEITLVLSGTAVGGDTFGEAWARYEGIPIKLYPAPWRINGQFDITAGIKRNIQMAENADALVAIWDGESKGTQHMIAYACAMKLKVFVHCPQINKILKTTNFYNKPE